VLQLFLSKNRGRNVSSSPWEGLRGWGGKSIEFSIDAFYSGKAISVPNIQLTIYCNKFQIVIMFSAKIDIQYELATGYSFVQEGVSFCEHFLAQRQSQDRGSHLQTRFTRASVAG
jgi:hypothetical protein